MKADACHFENCRFSQICNHIHCVRDNCNYVLHSSGQLLSHKRKHERSDSEQAYRRFKMTQKGSTSSNSSSPSLFSGELLNKVSVKHSLLSPEITLTLTGEGSSSTYNSEQILQNMITIKHHNKVKIENLDDDEKLDNLEDGIPKSIIQNTSFLDKANSIEEAEQMIRTYFSDFCTRQYVDEPLNLKNENNKQLNPIECFMMASSPHFHCLVPACEAVLPKSLNDISEHMKMHELTKSGEIMGNGSNLQQITSIEGFFNRKRGRPPKNRVVEVYNNVSYIKTGSQHFCNKHFRL